jgi:subtilisin family serine protease
LLIRRTVRPSLRRIAAILAAFAVAGTFLAGAIGPVARAAPVTTNFPLHAEFSPNDPFFNCFNQWGLCKIGAPSAWDATLGSPSVVVAVVDTGVWWTHEDIQANMWVNPSDGTSHGYDFIDGDSNPMDNDPSGVYHGTGVAGVIAAITNNNKDIAGVAQVKVMALRALGLNGQGSSLNTSQAIRWAAQHGARVINLSLGTNETFSGPTDIQLAIDYAWSRGALVVAAAGNAGTSTLDYPARLTNVVSVAAIDESGYKASFSNYGPGLDLAAPGTTVLTLDGNNGLHTLQGTSFAAPFVTGAAALLLSVDRNLTNVELWNILNSTAVQPGSGSGYNTNYGWGVVNAWNAINALSQPFISVNAYPTTVSRSSSFSVTWSILGPAGAPVTDTHMVWGTASGRLGNATPSQTGTTHQSYTASGMTLPSGVDTLYFKVVARVNGTNYESREYTVAASNLPDFLFVLYQLLASNLLYLALFILALAAVVAFIPQRRAARARRAGYRARGLYPTNYYVQGPGPSQPPQVPMSQPPPTTTRGQPRAEGPPPPIEFVRPAPAQPTMSAPIPSGPVVKKRCPNCGTMVNADNMFCFFCGNPFR